MLLAVLELVLALSELSFGSFRALNGYVALIDSQIKAIDISCPLCKLALEHLLALVKLNFERGNFQQRFFGARL